MLPNHARYIIAEQFGTLARLFPGRIDLGLARALGTDQLTLRALRRTPQAAESFPQDVLEVQAFLTPVGPNQRIKPCLRQERKCRCGSWDRAISAQGRRPNSSFHAFASYFAPELLIPALQNLPQPLQTVRAA